MEFLNHYDAETRKLKLRKPVARTDSAPQDPNPVRAFREELRLTRHQLSAILDVPWESIRRWERHKEASMPSSHRLQKLLICARRNQYPLFFADMLRYVEDSRV
jgi:DNA-binding transcriptional regulator YiaG